MPIRFAIALLFAIKCVRRCSAYARKPVRRKTASLPSHSQQQALHCLTLVRTSYPTAPRLPRTLSHRHRLHVRDRLQHGPCLGFQALLEGALAPFAGKEGGKEEGKG